MGQLVFQATLGGAVNLIGPNIAGTVNFTLPSADGTSGQALSTNGSGTLAFSSFATLVSNTFTGSQTLSAGTANGVTYLNGSKVLTSGSALVFDGTNGRLGIATTTPTSLLSVGTLGTSINPAIQIGSATNSSGSLYFGDGTASDTYRGYVEYSHVSDALLFGASGTEGMRLNSTGLGIGTSSPDSKLVISGYTGGSYNTAFNNSSQNNFIVHGTSGYTMFRKSDGTELMRLDSSGNLGLGVTPSAWGSAYKVQQIGAQGIEFYSGGTFGIGNNFYNSGSGNFRIAADYVTLYQQTVGQHQWLTAGTSTAGSAVSFTQAMTLDASGNLLVGTTSATYSAAGRGGIEVNGSSTAISALKIGGSAAGYTYHDGTVLSLNNVLSGALVLATNNAERARITSGGSLCVGRTAVFSTNTEKLSVEATGNSPAILAINAAGATDYTYVSWNTATSGDNKFVGFFTEASPSPTLRGSITYNRAGGLTVYNTTSDYRAKDISGPVTGSGALIDSIPVYMGTMKGATQERPMFIAHEVPAYARTGEKDALDKDGNPEYQQMDASALIPVMWAEIQSLRQRLSAANL